MATKAQYQVAVVNEINLSNTAVTFGASATLSSIFTCGGTCPTGLWIPAGWSSGTIGFNVCKTPGGTFVPLTDFTGAAFTVTAAASTFVPLQPAMFNSVLFLQLVSSVSQTDMTVDLSLSPVFQGLHG